MLQYCDDTIGGKIPACKWVKLACQRHLNDLETGSERGLFFDAEKAQHRLNFYNVCIQTTGEWAGQILTPEPFQVFIKGSLYGWLRADGTRRFRTAFISMARKNGKTTDLATDGLYLMVADNEPGAQIYSAATRKEQARICHTEATRMVQRSPQLRKKITIFRDNLHILDTCSKFEPISSDAKTLDGLNISGALCDELHQWQRQTNDVWSVLETATGARRQPLQIAITTAGFDRQSICYEQQQYSEKILSGVIEDDTYFGICFCLDENDDWQDEAVWGKSNPNLNVSVKIDDLRRKAAQALEIPSRMNAFLRLHMNEWTQAETRWLSAAKWKLCGVDPVNEEGLRGRTCYAGLDLSSTTDVSALVYVFPPEIEGEDYQVLCRFWIPQENMINRVRRDRVPYDVWCRQGFVEATPGNVIDYDFILAKLDEDAQKFDIKELAFDRWGATLIIQKIEEQGLTVAQFGQGFASMAAPTKELEKLVLGSGIAHGNNPVLSWMADNVVVRQDPAGNLKPDKEKSIEKIDGIVALIMALDRATRQENSRSIYEERGVLVL